MYRFTFGRDGLAGTVGSALMIGAIAACASRVEQTADAPASPRGRPDSTAAAGALVIEQFLRAASTRDLTSMARLFGTKRGPIIELYDRHRVDQRMLALAALLKHDGYTIRSDSTVSGRTDGARRVTLRMRVRGRARDVPYTLVWSQAGTWLIEQIDLEGVTAR